MNQYMPITSSASSSLPSMLLPIICSVSDTNYDILSFRFNLVQKSEAGFIKKVKMKFGGPTDTTIIIGDWSAAHMRFHAPSKGKGFRTMFKRAGYDVFLVNEHLSSSVCPVCDQESLETFRRRLSPRPWRRRHIQKVHGLLRCKSVICQFSVNGRLVQRFWNRDDVATLSFRAIVAETIASQTAQFPQGIRPARYS